MDILVQNNDTQLFTTVHPNPGKETVILLHGGPGVPNGLTFVTKFLQQDFQVVLFHQRGTLKSPTLGQNYAFDNYISDINAIADYLKLDKFHLFGHSWGGLYAQVYAQKNPHKLLSLFLCSPGSGTGRQWKEAMLEIAHYNKVKCNLKEWLAMNINSALGLLGSDQAYNNFYRQALANFSRGFQESYPELFAIDCIKAKAINQTTKAILKYPLLPEIIVPGFKITLTYGDKDIFGDSKKYVLQRYPTAMVSFIPDSGHIPWSHNQPAFIKILKDHYKI